MKHKGMIVKINKNYAIVMLETGEYFKITVKNNMEIGKKIVFLEDDIIKKNISKKGEKIMKNKKNGKLKIIGTGIAACLALVLVLGYNLLPGSTQPYALVSIDINPSIEMQIDDDLNVLEIKSLNDDGVNVINDEMIGDNLLNVIDEIVLQAEEKNYLRKDNNSVLISAATFENGNSKIVSEKITNHVKENQHLLEDVVVIYLESDKETAEKSMKSGVSLGKTEVARMANDESVQDLTVKKIVNDKELSSLLVEKVISSNDSEELMMQQSKKTLIRMMTMIKMQ